MALLSMLFVLVQSLIQYPQPAGDGLDEATHRRMKERQQLLDHEMARLLQELEQQDEGWGAVLFGALQQWPFWVLAGVVLLLGLWFSCRRRSHEASSSGKDQSSCKTLGDDRGRQLEEDSCDSEEDGKSTDVTVEAVNSSSGKDRDLHKENEGGRKDVQVEEDKDAGKEEEGEGNEEKTIGGNRKAGNNDDVNEGEDSVNGPGQYTDVKVQENSDASEQRSRDCTGQGHSRDHGNEAGHSGFAASEEENKEVIEDGNDRNNDEEQDDMNMEANKKEDRNEDKQGNVLAREKEDSDGGKEESGSGGMEDREKPGDAGNEQGILLVDRIEWPVEDLERACSVITELMESLTRVFVDSVSNSFYPVPQEAIGVGSAFEGWSPRDWDGVYRVLVPLNAPPGHAFQLELNSAGQVAARTFSVRVELVCTCHKEQLGEEPLCFLHHSQKELRRKQKRSLLGTLCTGSYLDVGKTSLWFCQLVRGSWLQVPQWHSWHLVLQPCSRSCRLQLSKGRKSLTVEMLFGVRQGDSDIFVVSQPTEAQKGGSSIFVSSQPTKANIIASTAWPETYAVAEAKFFRHIARQLPCESLHLKCLQLFTCILRGTGFSSSTWKTVLMHVLTTVPLSRWHRSAFPRRLWDVMAYLDRCLQLTRLEHFVLGNERLPAEIILPPAMRGVEPPNLFEHLARDPAALREAMQAYGRLRFRLWVLLSSH
ncbi:inositol 1,4,5-trisphosphate receptor-interacting protein-like [Molothrus aeneus]|uniref:inositol 1,4,5-trisphosphate receptor-interacting protein-like n=1 Tax=Molothrus aeneus TaxID=84833 RepID=UPI0034587B0A